MWASASSSPATAAEAADLADRRKSPFATEARRHHPAARRRGGRGGHGGTRWRRGRAPPQGERGPPCASRVQSERPRRRHHREPCRLPAGPSGDGEGGRWGWWLAVAARGSAARVARGGGDAGASGKNGSPLSLPTVQSIYW
jgi:hypothetical protein